MYRNSNDKRIKTSQKMIFKAWATLIETKPHGAIRINELCEEAKVGRVTFYRLYDHLDDLIRQKLDEDFLKAKDYLFRYRISHPKSKGIIKPLLLYFHANPTLIAVVLKAKLSHLLHERFLANFLQIQPVQKEENEYFLLSLRVSIAINILEKWVANQMKIQPEVLIHAIKKRMNQALDELE
jgi:AcrR family transcriptional regulator